MTDKSQGTSCPDPDSSVSFATAVENAHEHGVLPDSRFGVDGVASLPERWESRRSWLRWLHRDLASRSGRECLRRHGPALRTACVVGGVVAGIADRKTGANVFASEGTIAEEADRALRGAGSKTGIKPRHLRNVLKALQERGHIVLVEPAQWRGGDRPTNLWRLVTPTSIPGRIAADLEVSTSSTSSHVSSLDTKRAVGAKAAPKRKSAQRPGPLPLSAVKLAGQLINRDQMLRTWFRPEFDSERGTALPAGTKIRHPGSLARCLAQHLDTSKWTANDLIALFDTENWGKGWSSLTQAREPVGYLKARLRRLGALLLLQPREALDRLRQTALAEREERFEAAERAKAEAEREHQRRRAAALRRKEARAQAEETRRRAEIVPATAEQRAKHLALFRSHRPPSANPCAAPTPMRSAS